MWLEEEEEEEEEEEKRKKFRWKRLTIRVSYKLKHIPKREMTKTHDAYT